MLKKSINFLSSTLCYQVPLVASNRIGKEIIQTEHGKSEITFYGNSFIAGNSFVSCLVFHCSIYAISQFIQNV